MHSKTIVDVRSKMPLHTVLCKESPYDLMFGPYQAFHNHELFIIQNEQYFQCSQKQKNNKKLYCTYVHHNKCPLFHFKLTVRFVFLEITIKK